MEYILNFQRKRLNLEPNFAYLYSTHVKVGVFEKQSGTVNEKEHPTWRN